MNLTTEKIEQFSPTSVDSIQQHLWRKIDNDWNSEPYEYVLRKNIAYNFQYLQYLDNQILSNPSEHSVIRKLQYKTFIVTAWSILEAIMYHELKKGGYIKKQEYAQVDRKSINGKRQDTKIEIYYYEKIHELEQEDEFLKAKDLVERCQKYETFGKDSKIYAKINGMRKLRDKVHIYISPYRKDTDWNSFKEDVYERNKETFLEIYSIYFEEDINLQNL